MSVNLQKGEAISLIKNKAGLKNIKICLGWDPIHSNSLFGKMKSFLFNGSDLDLDAVAILIDNKNDYEIVCFYHLLSNDGSVIHSGDNLTGEGKMSDKEQIFVDLEKISDNVNKIIFCVNIYNAVVRSQNFGMVNNSFIRIVDMDTQEEFCRYNLSGKNYENYKSMQFGSLVKNNRGEWTFEASGIGYPYSSIKQLKDVVTSIN